MQNSKSSWSLFQGLHTLTFRYLLSPMKGLMHVWFLFLSLYFIFSFWKPVWFFLTELQVSLFQYPFGHLSHWVFWGLFLAWQHLSLLFLSLHLLEEYEISVLLLSISLNSSLTSICFSPDWGVGTSIPTPQSASPHSKGVSSMFCAFKSIVLLLSVSFFFLEGQIFDFSELSYSLHVNLFILCGCIFSQLLLNIPIKIFIVLFPPLIMLQVTCSACLTCCLSFRLLVFFNYLALLGYLLIYRWVYHWSVSINNKSVLSNCHPSPWFAHLCSACGLWMERCWTCQLLSKRKSWASCELLLPH